MSISGSLLARSNALFATKSSRSGAPSVSVILQLLRVPALATVPRAVAADTCSVGAEDACGYRRPRERSVPCSARAFKEVVFFHRHGNTDCPTPRLQAARQRRQNVFYEPRGPKERPAVGNAGAGGSGENATRMVGARTQLRAVRSTFFSQYGTRSMRGAALKRGRRRSVRFPPDNCLRIRY